MKRIAMIVAVFLTVFVAFSGLATADVLSDIKARGKMIVGTSADYPPYEYKDANNQFAGYDMDLIREIGKRIGVEVEIRDMAFDILIAALQKNKIDVVIAATPERDKKIDFSTTYHVFMDAFLAKKGSGIKMTKPDDAAKYKIAVQTGTTYEKWVMKNLVDTGKTPKKNVFSYESIDNAALDVAAGRVDILMMTADVAKKHEEKSGLEVLLATDETVVGTQCIALPEGEKALKAEIDKQIKAITADGTMQKLLDKHGMF